MPYLDQSGFLHDIFVSYAHGLADRQGVKRLKHWTERLRDELYGEIVDLLPEFRELDIFIDRDLDPTLPLTGQIRKDVSSSGLLLVAMSEHYLNSAWCGNEREWFEGEVAKRDSEGGLVLVVRVQPTDHERWPACLKDERDHVVLGFPFHPNAQPGQLIQPFGWPEPLPQDRDYYRELGRLAGVVTQRLRELRQAQELKKKAALPRVEIRIEGEPAIYLEAPVEGRQLWDKTRAKLVDVGCRVLPKAFPSPGGEFAAIQQARKERIKLLHEEANALCLIRPASANGRDDDIKAVVTDRTDLEAFFGKRLPCAILDHGGGNLPLARDLGIASIDASEANAGWMADLQGWLHGALVPGP